MTDRRLSIRRCAQIYGTGQAPNNKQISMTEILDLKQNVSKSPHPPFAKGGRGRIYDFHISWVAKSPWAIYLGFESWNL
jgi:hypothetical protein